MEATLNLLQPLFKDIQNLLGGSVLFQGQGVPCLGQALLEKGGLRSDLVLFPTQSPASSRMSPLCCSSPLLT